MPPLIRLLLGVSAIALVSSCGFVAPRVELLGTPGGLARLSGEWWGEYTGDGDHARRGTIAFKLVAGEDHAHGDVVMSPADDDLPYRPYRDTDQHMSPQELARRSRVLEIRFVILSENLVSGVIEPYWDPDRHTQASTTFRGRLATDTIDGTFITRYASGSASTGGRWKVWRTR